MVALAIAVAGVVVRAVAWQAFGAHPLETFEYETIAHNLVAGRGYGMELYGTWYQTRTFGSPVFTYLCAFLYAVFGQHQETVLAAQWFFASAIAFGSFLIGSRVFTPHVGVAAAFLAGFHPGIFYYDIHKLHPLGFDAALLVWGTLALLFLRTHSSNRAAFLVGAFHGVIGFERSTFVGLIPVAAVVMWRWRERRLVPGAIALYALGLMIAPGLWIGRTLLLGESVLVSTSGAEIFWRGNNVLASGGAFAEGRPGVPVFAAMPETFKARILGQDEVTQSRVFLQDAKTYLVEHPSAALRLYGRKLLAFWWFSPQSGSLYPFEYLRMYKGYYVSVLVLALIGMAGISRLSVPAVRWAGSLIFLMISVALLQAAFYVEIRHRWGVEPLLLLFAVWGGYLVIRGPLLAQRRTQAR